MKILLVNDTSESRNQGCQVTMFTLNKILADVFSGAEIKRIPLSVINHRFSEADAAEVLPGRTQSAGAAAKKWQSSKLKVLRDLEELLDWSDLVLINGEGSVLEAQNNAKMIYTICALSSLSKKECHLLNFTAHITKQESRELATEAFGMIDSVAVREPISYALVKRFHAGVKLYPDIVLGASSLLDERSSSVQAPAARYVMIGGGSATLNMARRAQSQRFKHRILRMLKRDSLVNHFNRLVRSYAEIRNAALSVGYKVCLMGWYRDEWLERLVCDGVEYFECDFRGYLEIARNADLNFTGRHHGCVMSASAGRPFLTTTANCFKNFGDVEFYGSPGSVFELERLDSEGVKNVISTVSRKPDFYRKEATKRSQELFPFAFGAFARVLRPFPDVVESGVFPMDAGDVSARFVQNMKI